MVALGRHEAGDSAVLSLQLGRKVQFPGRNRGKTPVPSLSSPAPGVHVTTELVNLLNMDPMLEAPSLQ